MPGWAVSDNGCSGCMVFEDSLDRRPEEGVVVRAGEGGRRESYIYFYIHIWIYCRGCQDSLARAWAQKVARRAGLGLGLGCWGSEVELSRLEKRRAGCCWGQMPT
jgi:hypothetical protein